jgi:peroxiredoxin
VQEFPELVTTARKYDMRNFEFITISADKPEDSAKVKTFLEKRGAGISDRSRKAVKAEGRTTNSYLFTGTTPEDMMKVLDPEWPGAIPHTVLVGPNGDILWRHNGAVDGEELRAKVLEAMGPYYVPGTR